MKIKNTVISLYFRIGVDVLGFPVSWKHMIFRQQNNSFLGIKSTVNISQSLIKQL